MLLVSMSEPHSLASRPTSSSSRSSYFSCLELAGGREGEDEAMAELASTPEQWRWSPPAPTRPRALHARCPCSLCFLHGLQNKIYIKKHYNNMQVNSFAKLLCISK